MEHPCEPASPPPATHMTSPGDGAYLLRKGGAGRWCTSRLPSQPVPRASGTTMLRPRYKTPSPSSSSLFSFSSSQHTVFNFCQEGKGIFGTFPDLQDQLFVDRLASAQVFEEELLSTLQRFMSCFDPPPMKLELAAVGLCACARYLQRLCSTALSSFSGPACGECISCVFACQFRRTLAGHGWPAKACLCGRRGAVMS